MSLLLLLPIALSASACVLDVAPFGEGILLLGRDSMFWEGTPGVFAAADAECDRLFGPAISADGSTAAVWAGSDDRDCIVLVRSTGVEILGPYGEAGLPTWDADAALWFTAEGELLREGEPVGIPLEAHHISVSPEADRIVYTDRNDRILVLSLPSGEIAVLSGEYRFYAPFFTPTGWIVSPSLDGGIWIFSEDGAVSAGSGEQPVWWAEADRLVFQRTTDDGEQLLTSDLWSWTPGGGAECLAETFGILETQPAPAAGGIHYVDAATGRPGFLAL